MSWVRRNLPGWMKRTARRVIGVVRRFYDPYGKWLQQHIAARQARLTVHSRPGQFSLLTCVYERTPPHFFAETAAGVFAQTSPKFEWVLLAHGPIPDELERVIARVATDPRVKLLRLDKNLGIIGGMRHCLERAAGEYVVPLDADDLLTHDALHVVAQGIHDHTTQKPGFSEKPSFLFTDEDFLVDGRPQSPLKRTDFDPVLNLASSYVWHLCAFRRERALELGVYADAASNWCHDWDTLFRFVNAGVTPVHLPEIVYHWRTHEASNTNQTGPNAGSLDSQKHVLERQIARQPRPESYEVQPYPLFRGAPEWGIVRRPVETDEIEIVSHDRDDPNAVSELRESVAIVESPFVMVCAEGVIPRNEDWRWESLLLFEFHDDVGLIAGRIVDARGRIIGGGQVARPSARLSREYVCSDLGRRFDEPGPFAMWLKPRTVDAVDPKFFVARTEFLQRMLGKIGDDLPLTQFGRELGEIAAHEGLRVATSPLIVAEMASSRTRRKCQRTSVTSRCERD